MHVWVSKSESRFWQQPVKAAGIMFDLPKICHPHCSLLDYTTSPFKRSSCKCLIRACCSFSTVLATESTSPAHYTGKTLWAVVSAHFHITFCQSLSLSLSFSLSLSLCRTVHVYRYIFSVSVPGK